MNQFEKDINTNNQLNILENDLKEIKTQENVQCINKIGNIPQKPHQIKIISFFLSEFGFVFILGFILLLLFIIPQYHSAKVFTSKTQNQGFDSTYTPKIFIHTTDIHITLNRPKKLDGTFIFLTSLYEYKPDFFLMTGDILDNYIGNSKNTGGQNEEDLKVYKTAIRNNLSKFPVIDVSGNHDLWAVKDPISKNNNVLDYLFMFNRTNVKDENDFFIKKIKQFNLNFILLNDYRFPVIRPPYGVEPHTTSKQLDILEDTINNLDEDEYIILTHYPIDRALLTKSSKGHSIEEIVSNKKVGFIFSGHQHPNSVNIIHHGKEGGLEFCTSSAYDKKRAGLITIDNGNLIYHEVYIPYYGSKPLFFLTFPTPNEQITSHHIFNLKNFEIRVISYAPDNNIKLKIEGDIQGELNNIKTLSNGAFLYSYPVNLDYGSYKIHIYDESGYSCDINTEFTIGEKYKGKKEKYIQFPRFLLVARFMMILFWIFLLIIIIPLFPSYNFSIIEEIEKCISGDKSIDINKILFYIYLIILGPFILRLRFQKINSVLKYGIFIAFIYPLILPIHFMQNFDGVIAYTFLVFVVTKIKVMYEHWALQITCIYYVTVIFPYVLFSTGKYYHNDKFILFANTIISLCLSLLGFIINFIALNQSIFLGFLFITPGFIIIWIILLIISIKFYN